MAVAGLTLGADPLVSAVAVAAALAGPGPGGADRAQGGQGSWHRRLAGGSSCGPGSRITVLEDVVTTGGSSLQAVHQLREAGYTVERVVTIVDRQEGGLEAMTAAGLELRSFFLLDEVAAVSAAARS